jgi:glycosyltransferase involved in cell wall biosynthesis
MFKELPLISVIIPTYNYGIFIREALESIFAQTYPIDKIEVIVVDDGSTDDTKSIIEKNYGEKLTYIYHENRGLASAKNTGISCAKGNIITFLDADDILFPGRIRKIVDMFIKHNEIGMIYHNLEVIDVDGKTISENFYKDYRYKEDKNGWIFPDIVNGNIFCGGNSFAFRAELLKMSYPIPADIRRGVDFYSTALAACYSKALYIPEILYKYRIHKNNLTFSNTADLHTLAVMHKDFSITYEKVLKRLKQIPSAHQKNIRLLKRRYHRSCMLSSMLAGHRVEGLKHIPVLFRLSYTAQDLLSSLGLSMITFLLPRNFYPKLVKMSQPLKGVVERSDKKNI